MDSYDFPIGLSIIISGAILGVMTAGGLITAAITAAAVFG
ncbi:hypothetical protein ES708_21019 [subsurface metagenome]